MNTYLLVFYTQASWERR